MNSSPGQAKEVKQLKFVSDVLVYVKRSKGLHAEVSEAGSIRIQQSVDGKSIVIDSMTIDDVILRSDVAGEDFIQVNFSTGNKILLTDALIGFKPANPQGLDASRIPRVVTTPDVVNVFEAIQDSLHVSGPGSHEMSILKKVYEAVLNGGEAVGFDLSVERSWLTRIPNSYTKLSS